MKQHGNQKNKTMYTKHKILLLLQSIVNHILSNVPEEKLIVVNISEAVYGDFL